MTLRIELLPAGYGDAILVAYGDGATPQHHILIDAGQATTSKAVLQRLAALRAAGGAIDLFVVTHIDNDHIGGALKLLADPAAAGMIQSIWFNGYVHLDKAAGLLGPIQGEKLTKQIVDLGLDWNPGWPLPVQPDVGGPIVVTKPTTRELPGEATALVLSPTPQKLVRLQAEWDEVVSKAGLRPDQDAEEEPELLAPGLLGASLDDLADTPTPIDTAAANGSSIAFVFEYGGKRVLFGADAHPDVLTAAFAQLAEKPYRLDACKLPHHGSKGNVTVGLIEALDCPLWLVSSNGVRFRHPDDAALARVIVKGTRGDRRPSIAWNYHSDRCKAFTSTYRPSPTLYRSLKPTVDGWMIDL
jgi:beta-lactamase superfamily II metal-dependent hydrolase